MEGDARRCVVFMNLIIAKRITNEARWIILQYLRKWYLHGPSVHPGGEVSALEILVFLV